MRKPLALLSLCLLIAFCSCTHTSGVDVTEYFDASTYYYRLEVSDGMIVTVSDDVDEIVITADENIMEKIEVKFISGTLRIFRRDFSMTYLSTAQVTLPYNPALKEVKVSYDSEFHTSYGLEAEKVTVAVHNRSKFYGYIYSDEFDLELSDHSYTDIVFDVSDFIDLNITEHSEALLDGYTYSVHLVMLDNAKLRRQWNGNHFAFMCDYCYGSMNSNCTAYIDCDSEIAMSLYNNSFLYYTSHPYVGESIVDESSGIVDDGD